MDANYLTTKSATLLNIIIRHSQRLKEGGLVLISWLSAWRKPALSQNCAMRPPETP